MYTHTFSYNHAHTGIAQLLHVALSHKSGRQYTEHYLSVIESAALSHLGTIHEQETKGQNRQKDEDDVDGDATFLAVLWILREMVSAFLA